MGAFVLFVVLFVDVAALIAISLVANASSDRHIETAKWIEEQRALGKGPAKGKGLHHTKPGRRTAAVIQISILLFCYCVARFVASTEMWKQKQAISAIFLAFGLGFVPLGGILLGRLIPHIAMVTARGDLIFQEYHINWLHVILQLHVGHSDTALAIGPQGSIRISGQPCSSESVALVVGAGVSEGVWKSEGSSPELKNGTGPAPESLAANPPPPEHLAVPGEFSEQQVRTFTAV
eukprot:gnl/TRDRNA2_/TRDRNA2_88385_c1_seq1.p1 gnl/TRDRNA2_/TRDRNA2_88385_c1~~gnl/TRDRNA2_/TRDRNA2_88385_c1_seq1.p1  ORF type:complete len:257 (+),score=39.93 gnl/TRDRNA2_/TRDRNA2_88385_c1_seq1:68-772(+)